MASHLHRTDTMSTYGQRLLPTVIDDAAQNEHDRVLFYNPRGNDPRQGYDQVTTKIFANAIDSLCVWIESTIGPTPKTFAYVASNDLRYFMFMVAAAKMGHRVLLSSPRNSIDAHESLVRQSGCEWWVTSSSGVADDGTKSLISRLNIAHTTAPELADLLRQDIFSPSYPYKKSFEQGRSDVLALLHTSGSTGLPKLVPLYLGTASAMDAMHLMEPIEGRQPSVVEWEGTRTLCAMPLFHTAGISFGLYGAIFFRWTVILPPTGPLVQHVVEESLDSIRLDSAFIPPSVLQDMSKSPRALDKLSRLKFVASAGGPILPSVGKAIHAHVPIFQIMGMTELQLVASVSTHAEDWQYFHFHPRVGFEMEPASTSADGNNKLFQLVYVKSESLRLTQSIFVTFPHVDRWESKDLYSRHPTKAHLYKYEMRADDVILLSNGEKFGPLAAEAKLIGHPMIRSAYITGRERFQAGLLLYPTENTMKMADSDIIDKVWPTVRAINESLPSFAQIHRGFVKIVRSQFALTPKGTMARKATEALFAKEIEELYAPSDRGEFPLQPIDTTSPEALQDGVAETVRAIASTREIAADDSLFSVGFDSLHVLRLARILSSSLATDVKAGAIYENPSIAQLSTHLWAQLRHEQQDQGSSSMITRFTHRAHDDTRLNGYNHSKIDTQAATINRMLTKHSPSFRGVGKSRLSEGEYVVLTGSTGSIGPFLLEQLCQNERVAGIWCLNRRKDARQRQVQLARANGLSLDWENGGKVQFLCCDVSSVGTLGLNRLQLQDILDRATVIIHNAWEVNFNLSLPSFDPHILGLETLVDICRRTRAKIRFYFMSSISAAMHSRRDTAGPHVLEAKISDPEAPMNGYGASKWVAEHLLACAADAGVMNLSVFRVGQVGGPVETFGHGSMWSRKDWVPALIDASAHLRMLPSNLGLFNDLDWIPVDLLAKVLDQLIFGVSPTLIETEKKRQGGKCNEVIYYNVMNPATIPWSELLSTLRTRLGASIPGVSHDDMQVVPLQEWIAKLQNSEAAVFRYLSTPPGHDNYTNGDVGISKVHTGLALVEFFHMLDEVNTRSVRVASKMQNGHNENASYKVDWAMEKVISGSSVLANLPPVSPAWMETWLEQWGYIAPP